MNCKSILLIILCLMLCLSCFGAAFAEGAAVQVPQVKVAQRPIPDNEAMAFLKKMGVGWNLGNTFDAIKQGWNKNADEMTLETVWCGVATSEKMFDALKEAGFTAVRIPVSWHDHVSGPDHEISERWMSRVQEVVDWAMERGFYVILNTHHDEDQFEPSAKHFEESAHYIECVWRQIGERFMDYDEHLILESMNEPRLVGTAWEWSWDPASPECLEAADCINHLNQLFVDIIRAAGGNNAERWLSVPAYCAAPWYTVDDAFVLPEDPAGRLIVASHAYTPYNFALNTGSDDRTFNLDTDQDKKSEITWFLDALYKRFVVKGVPVLMDEFGALDKGGNLQDRVNFTSWYVASASARGITCVWWDNGAFSGPGERFGLINRKTAKWAYPEITEAIMANCLYNREPGEE